MNFKTNRFQNVVQIMQEGTKWFRNLMKINLKKLVLFPFLFCWSSVSLSFTNKKKY